MRIISLHGISVSETSVSDFQQALDNLRLPDQGYLWLACSRSEFGQMQVPIQAMLDRLCGLQLMELHVSDLLNQQLPSRYDYTSQYDLLVFRRLAASVASAQPPSDATLESSAKRRGPPILRQIGRASCRERVFRVV